MFIHAGASLHGREMSPRKRDESPSKGSLNHHQQLPQQPPQPRNRSVPLLRSALRPFGDSRASATNYTSKHARFSLSSPSTTGLESGRRSLTEPVLPTSPSDLAPPSDSVSSLPLASLPSLPPISPSIRPRHRRPLSDPVSNKGLGIRVREPTAAMSNRASAASSFASDDEESLVGSDVTDFTINSSTRRSRRRRSLRRGTSYSLAHPPPRRLTKQRSLIQFRPSMLLQLQRVEGRRPVPAFDILPSSTISTSFLLPRLAQRIPRIRRTKAELGPDDLVVVRSEDYESGSNTHKKGHEKLEHRDLMGVVSPLSKFGDDVSEIIMGDGSIWSTALLPKGSYEFHCIDDQGIRTTARWAKKPVKPARRSSEIHPSPAPTPPEYKWTFSIMDPLNRRHPVMGVLTSHDLTVYNTYNALSTSSGRYPPTKPFTNFTAMSDPPAVSPTPLERATLEVPEDYKHLMIVTASWISLRLKGWPDFANPTFRRNSMHCRNASTGSASVAKRRRSYPLAKDDKNAMSGPSTHSPHVSDERPQVRPQDSVQTEPPKRHMSTGAAYMRQRKMNRKSLEEGKSVKETQRIDKENTSQPVVRTKGLGGEEERTVTCRIKVRKLTQKLFRRDAHRKEVPVS